MVFYLTCWTSYLDSWLWVKTQLLIRYYLMVLAWRFFLISRPRFYLRDSAAWGEFPHCVWWVEGTNAGPWFVMDTMLAVCVTLVCVVCDMYTRRCLMTILYAIYLCDSCMCLYVCMYVGRDPMQGGAWWMWWGGAHLMLLANLFWAGLDAG